jgi:hypothetical protein
MKLLFIPLYDSVFENLGAGIAALHGRPYSLGWPEIGLLAVLGLGFMFALLMLFHVMWNGYSMAAPDPLDNPPKPSQ